MGAEAEADEAMGAAIFVSEVQGATLFLNSNGWRSVRASSIRTI